MENLIKEYKELREELSEISVQEKNEIQKTKDKYYKKINTKNRQISKIENKIAESLLRMQVNNIHDKIMSVKINKRNMEDIFKEKEQREIKTFIIDALYGHYNTNKLFDRIIYDVLVCEDSVALIAHHKNIEEDEGYEMDLTISENSAIFNIGYEIAYKVFSDIVHMNTLYDDYDYLMIEVEFFEDNRLKLF